MKIRTGFVSNSSSSSFICNVCGEDYSGMDASLDDAEMFECLHGHTVCDSHKVEAEATQEPKPEDWECPACGLEEEECCCEEEDVERYEMPVKYCPICQFKEVDTDEAYVYLLNRAGLTKETLLAELAGKFKDYNEFQTHLEKVTK